MGRHMTLPVSGESPSQAEAHTFAYDVFVVHAAADEAFVQGYLLPELGLAPERILVPKKLRPGRPIIGEIERGVYSSRVTTVVLSSAYIRIDRKNMAASGWTQRARGRWPSEVDPTRTSIRSCATGSIVQRCRKPRTSQRPRSFTRTSEGPTTTTDRIR